MNNKNYDEWNVLKKKISHNRNSNHPKIREIWWINLGLNIGSEIYGKGSKYLRPVLVVKANDTNFIGFPLSSKIRKDSGRVTLKTNDLRYHSVVMNQVKVFDNKRLINRKYVLSKNKFKKILRKFKNMITANG
jgi:mRNA interferase MazF